MIKYREENRLLNPKGEKAWNSAAFGRKKEADYAPTSNFSQKINKNINERDQKRVYLRLFI